MEIPQETLISPSLEDWQQLTPPTALPPLGDGLGDQKTVMLVMRLLSEQVLQI